MFVCVCMCVCISVCVRVYVAFHWFTRGQLGGSSMSISLKMDIDKVAELDFLFVLCIMKINVVN